MKFAYHATMCPPDEYLPLAIAAEELGFDTFTFPDSICYPKEGSDVYPYNDDGTRDFLDGVPFLEPFVAIPLPGCPHRKAALHNLSDQACHQAACYRGQTAFVAGCAPGRSLWIWRWYQSLAGRFYGQPDRLGKTWQADG